MNKYILVFKNQVHRKFEHKFDFFLKRLQAIVSFLILYSVWINAASTRNFLGYSKLELVSYVVCALVFGALIFGIQSKDVAFEINTGTISGLLVKPISFFWYCFAREGAERIIAFSLSLIEISVLWFFLRFHIFIQTDPAHLGLFVISIILAIFVYHLLAFIVSLSAFWSREAYGPKWLFEWVAIFAAGQYFPLSILAPFLHYLLLVLPLSLVLYFPLLIYLGRISMPQMLFGILAQVVWLFIEIFLMRRMWKQGLKIYTGEGI